MLSPPASDEFPISRRDRRFEPEKEKFPVCRNKLFSGSARASISSLACYGVVFFMSCRARIKSLFCLLSLVTSSPFSTWMCCMGGIPYHLERLLYRFFGVERMWELHGPFIIAEGHIVGVIKLLRTIVFSFECLGQIAQVPLQVVRGAGGGL